jgi:hypothetical protein
MYILQGRHSDCAIVSLANYTGKDYDSVLTVCAALAGRTVDEIRAKGTPGNIISTALAVLTGKHVRKTAPRRGQDKINGVVSWHKPGRKNGHMTAVIDGHVFDTNGDVMTVPEYRTRKGYCIRNVFSPE